MKILFYGFRHNHIRALYKKALASPDFEIVGCVEPDPAARAAAEEALGIPFSNRSYVQWLADPELDAVAIGTAYGKRGEAVYNAMRAGKHVIVDKPLCTSIKELWAIETASERFGGKIGCMLDLRDMPQTARAKEILDSGRLGQVRNITFTGQHCLDYAHRPAWYFEEGMHGGTINDLAIHGIDLVRLLTGREFVHVDGARVWNAYATRHPDFKDCATFMARLDGGAGVLADVSYSAPSQVFSMPTYWEFKIWCAKGYLTFHYTEDGVTLYEEGAKEPEVLAGLPAEMDYLDELIEAVQTGDSTRTEEVLRSTQTALTLQAYADKELAL